MAPSAAAGAAPPHEVLGIEPDADAATARRAFFQEARRWHPDKQPPGTSPEDLKAAQARFVAVHAAYEKFESSPCGDPQVTPPLQAMFQGSREALEKARAALAEAEEYVDALHEEALEGKDWSEEEQEVLRATWRRAFRVREELRRRVEEAKAFAGYEAALQASRKPRVPEPEPERTGPLDGPRTMSEDISDRVERVGNVLGEIYDDLLGGYFDAFRATRKGSSWSSWLGGEQLAER